MEMDDLMICIPIDVAVAAIEALEYTIEMLETDANINSKRELNKVFDIKIENMIKAKKKHLETLIMEVHCK